MLYFLQQYLADPTLGKLAMLEQRRAEGWTGVEESTMETFKRRARGAFAKLRRSKVEPSPPADELELSDDVENGKYVTQRKFPNITKTVCLSELNSGSSPKYLKRFKYV